MPHALNTVNVGTLKATLNIHRLVATVVVQYKSSRRGRGGFLVSTTFPVTVKTADVYIRKKK